MAFFGRPSLRGPRPPSYLVGPHSWHVLMPGRLTSRVPSQMDFAHVSLLSRPPGMQRCPSTASRASRASTGSYRRGP